MTRDRRALAVALLGAETAALVVLSAAGVVPRWPGLVHQVGLPPLDLFADTRLILTRAESYPVLVVGLSAAIVARAWILYTLARGPRARAAVALAHGAGVVVALVAAVLAYAGIAVSYPLFSWLALVLTVAGFAVLARDPGAGRPP